VPSFSQQVLIEKERRSPMVEPTMELLDWFRKQVEQAEGDVLQEMLRIFAETLMDADASAACNAGFNAKLHPSRTVNCIEAGHRIAGKLDTRLHPRWTLFDRDAIGCPH